MSKFSELKRLLERSRSTLDTDSELAQRIKEKDRIRRGLDQNKKEAKKKLRTLDRDQDES